MVCVVFFFLVNMASNANFKAAGELFIRITKIIWSDWLLQGTDTSTLQSTKMSTITVCTQ